MLILALERVYQSPLFTKKLPTKTPEGNFHQLSLPMSLQMVRNTWSWAGRVFAGPSHIIRCNAVRHQPVQPKMCSFQYDFRRDRVSGTIRAKASPKQRKNEKELSRQNQMSNFFKTNFCLVFCIRMKNFKAVKFRQLLICLSLQERPAQFAYG